MEHFELRCLCDYVGGAQAVNVWARPTPAAVFGELEADERGEIVFAEIWSPVTAPGVEEELKKIIIVLDGEEYGKYVSLSGIRATVMAPPKDRIWSGNLYSFGTPLDITQAVQNPLANTTLKYKQNVTVATLVGAVTAITQPYRIRLWGKVYKNGELPRFGQMGFPAYLTERTRNRTVLLTKAAIPINADTWLTLPGGKDQAIPKVNPFARYAYNLLPTDAMQGDYQFRLSTGGVAEEQENMYWEFDEMDALFIKGLGVKLVPTAAMPVPANLARTGLRIDGNYHPKGPTTRISMFPTTVGINELNFGHLAPFAPVAHPYYAAIPKLPQPYLIWNEIGYPVIRDDGVAAVALNTAVLALTGIRIEMRG
ncbi:unnamed protein product [marine sediment metagenome]|uniref:Uncharacterized protein n=2 Tax=marine sediment metagenome TaxID=412755 RepID=X1REJ1_9ZZZZ